MELGVRFLSKGDSGGIVREYCTDIRQISVGHEPNPVATCSMSGMLV